MQGLCAAELGLEPLPGTLPFPREILQPQPAHPAFQAWKAPTVLPDLHW